MSGIDTLLIVGSFMVVFLGSLAYMDYRSRSQQARRQVRQQMLPFALASLAALLVAGVVAVLVAKSVNKRITVMDTLIASMVVILLFVKRLFSSTKSRNAKKSTMKLSLIAKET